MTPTTAIVRAAEKVLGGASPACGELRLRAALEPLLLMRFRCSCDPEGKQLLSAQP